MKKVLFALFVISISSVLLNCSSIPVQRPAYDGDTLPRDKSAQFYMEEDWFVGLILFKIDGKTCPAFYPKSISYTDWKGGFNVALLPGSHIFEFVMPDDKMVETVSFTLEAGAVYELKKDDEKLTVIKKTTDGDKKVDVRSEKLITYKEPSAEASHGTLVQNDETVKEGYFVIARIDGLPGTDGGRTLAVARQRSFELRLTPGKHIIEYQYSSGAQYSEIFVSQVVSIEPGKKYRLRLSNINKRGQNAIQGTTEFLKFQ